MRDTSLVFPISITGDILLGQKKRGFGVGKWNGFGGKLEGSESYLACAIREVKEEVGLYVTPEELVLYGILFFEFQNNRDWNHKGYVYIATSFQGTPIESEEMLPQWFALDAIPYTYMWKADRIWLPHVLAREKVSGTILFSANGEELLKTDLKYTNT